MKLLRDYFKKDFNVALNNILRKKYTLRNIINYYKLRKFAQKIIRSTKNISLL